MEYLFIPIAVTVAWAIVWFAFKCGVGAERSRRLTEEAKPLVDEVVITEE